MPPNTTVFLLGLAVGCCLLLVGLFIGFWIGRRSVPSSELVDRQQFLEFLRELSMWTSELSGDVSKYQTQLNSISKQVDEDGSAPKEEIVGLLSKIMQANQQLQSRLDSAEEKLEAQTGQISNYLTEARTDALTGLQNRRAFDKSLDELYSKWKSKSQTFSLGLIDIDHFKQINDTYGHPGGDAVLKRIAAQLSESLRTSVCVARYGGEEFAVLATASARDTANALEQLRQDVEKIEVKHEEHTITVSLSAGAAEITSDDKIGNLVRCADEALYAAKLGGRNRVYIHDGTICRLVTKISAAQEQAAAEAARQSNPELEEKQSRVQARLARIIEEESRRVLER